MFKDVISFYLERFFRALAKDFIVKFAHVVVKQKDFDERLLSEDVLDYNTILPLHIFKSLTRFLF